MMRPRPSCAVTRAMTRKMNNEDLEDSVYSEPYETDTTV